MDNLKWLMVQGCKDIIEIDVHLLRKQIDAFNDTLTDADASGDVWGLASLLDAIIDAAELGRVC